MHLFPSVAAAGLQSNRSVSLCWSQKDTDSNRLQERGAVRPYSSLMFTAVHQLNGREMKTCLYTFQLNIFLWYDGELNFLFFSRLGCLNGSLTHKCILTASIMHKEYCRAVERKPHDWIPSSIIVGPQSRNRNVQVNTPVARPNHASKQSYTSNCVIQSKL